VQFVVLSCIGLASLCIILDGLVTVTLGVIKGIGKQAQATVAYLVCFYLISIPASYYFCFNLRFGLRGLYYGLLTGLVILILSLALIVK
jgi:multidrug resistance protein, MATE family